MPPWLPDAQGQNGTVIAVVARSAAQFDDDGYAVVVDGIVGPWFLPQWLDAVGQGRDVRCVILRPNRATALSRAAARGGPGDLVDPVPVGAMFDAFEHLGSFEAYVVDSTDLDAGSTADAVVEGLRRGRFVLSGAAVDAVRQIAASSGGDSPSTAP